MSIETLLTELDDTVIRRVGEAELSALSQTSKYYRTFTEPYLYSRIVLFTAHHERAALLFRTILHRQNLAKHINSLEVKYGDTVAATKGFTQEQVVEAWQSIILVKDTISSITKDGYLGLAVRWLSRVLLGPPSFDGGLAIVLCLASNLEVLDLETSSAETLPITREVLSIPWKDVASSELGFPFSKLRSLGVYGDGRHRVPHLPWLTSMRAKGRPAYRTELQLFHYPYADFETETKLTQLEIDAVTFDPFWLEEILPSPAFRALRQLIVSRTREYSEGSYEYDFQRISDAIVAHLPDLEILA